MLELALKLKASPYDERPLAGPRTVAVLFDKPTLRTQASFASGIAELGGFPMIIDGVARPDRRARVGRRHRARARTPGLGHRVAHPRAGPARGDGHARRRTRRQRAHRPVPPVPGARRPADRPRAPRHPRRPDARLRRRRRLQHGAQPAARRCDRRDARAGQRARRLRTRRRGPRPGPGDRAGHRRFRGLRRGPRRGGDRRRRRWPPTPGSRWAARPRPRRAPRCSRPGS